MAREDLRFVYELPRPATGVVSERLSVMAQRRVYLAVAVDRTALMNAHFQVPDVERIRGSHPTDNREMHHPSWSDNSAMRATETTKE